MVHHTNWYGHSSLYTHVPEHGAITGAPLCINTLATGYGDFRTSVAKRRQRATEISVFP